MAKLLPYIIGGTIVGILLGLIPLIQGNKNGKQSLGVVGFFACILCGALLGAILAIPVCLIFLWLVKRPATPPPPPPPPIA